METDTIAVAQRQVYHLDQQESLRPMSSNGLRAAPAGIGPNSVENGSGSVPLILAILVVTATGIFATRR